MAISYFNIYDLFRSTCGEVFTGIIRKCSKQVFVDDINYVPVEEKFSILVSTVYRFNNSVVARREDTILSGWPL
jgi:hypothetical protein